MEELIEKESKLPKLDQEYPSLYENIQIEYKIEKSVQKNHIERD